MADQRSTITAIMILSLVLLASICLISTEETMKIEVLKAPPKDCARKAANGDVISMHYRGTLEKDGKEFDSSYSRNQPFEFKLGAGMVISGWEQGIPGMCVGEKRKLIIPSSLAYGDSGFGDIIPAKSTLVFEIEMQAIKGYTPTDQETGDEDYELDEHHDHEHDHPDSFEALDTDGNKEISMEEMTQYIKNFQDEHDDGQVTEDSVETIVSEIFQEDDKNKDGVISLEEYQHSAGGMESENEETMEDGDMHEAFDEERDEL